MTAQTAQAAAQHAHEAETERNLVSARKEHRAAIEGKDRVVAAFDQLERVAVGRRARR